MKKRFENGFTLIELLVVIAIIVVLLSLSLLGIQGSRQSSRDSRRKADLESIRSALEFYKADKGAYFYSGSCALCSSCTGWIDLQGSGTCAQNMRVELATYLPQMPKDPAQTTDGNPCSQSGKLRYWYLPQDNGASYKIVSGLEKQSGSCSGMPAPDPGCTNTTSCYYVTNP